MQKSIFECGQCGSQYPKWVGRCGECGQWGTVKEGAGANGGKHGSRSTGDDLVRVKPGLVIPLAHVGTKTSNRMSTGIAEVDRVFGGGIVTGSVMLLGGEPGIGKSTLVLQIAAGLKAAGGVLYVAGEESPEQIRLRAERIGLTGDQISFLSETSVPVIQKTIVASQPSLVIVDSIQTLVQPEVDSEPGSISQIRAGCAGIMQVAKQSRIPVIVIGHVNKEGLVAGPKALEHLVDAVFYLEGERGHPYRLLRGEKNRFGSTNEVGVFDLREKGFMVVPNPSQLFLEGRSEASGSCVAAVMEGSRPFLVEVQALVAKTAFGLPLRRAVGFDPNRLHVLLAVMEKRARIPLSSSDVHLNVVGGLRLDDPAADLAVSLAIASAWKDQALPHTLAAVGEVGLGGEIRPVSRLRDRAEEARKLRFGTLLVPARGEKVQNSTDTQLVAVRTLSEAVQQAL